MVHVLRYFMVHGVGYFMVYIFGVLYGVWCRVFTRKIADVPLRTSHGEGEGEKAVLEEGEAVIRHDVVLPKQAA